MKRLTLIRHGKSDWNSPSACDFDRPLNGRGKRAATTMGERLAAADDMPQLLVSSPAKRARKTAKLIAQQLEYPETEIVFSEEIYEASLEALIELLHNLPDNAEKVLIVGHNPGFSELGQWLNHTAPDWLPTCGQLIMELPIANWSQAAENSASTLSYDYPKNSS